ncbi:MAG: extracellular solute-binding protein [Clostridiales bacterium]|jgi:spermidine/putrescine transport system substrate-binding protein|nr:extracellular solute-binding protein [Clostridiales bacterium]
MKKLLVCLLSALLLGGVAFSATACAPRGETLKILTWLEYIDEDYIKENFPAFFAEHTGGKISKIVVDTFENNEDLYPQIATSKKDYDIICPSDYLAERMIKEGLLKAIDKTIVTGYADLDPAILAKVAEFDVGKTYSFPYAWGTFGIMYNTSHGVTADDVNSWDALWNPEFQKHIVMRDASRDAFVAANIRHNRDALLNAKNNNPGGYGSTAYQSLLKTMFTSSDDQTIADVKGELIQQQSIFYKYGGEETKEWFQDNDPNASLGLYWSCDAGTTMPDNTNLRYSLPEEGANFYTDCYAISTYAKNPTAAQWFLQFMTDTDAAYANMVASGAPCAVTAANDLFRSEFEETFDDEYADGLFDSAEDKADFLDNFLNTVMFPDAETLLRCGVMRDYGDRNHLVEQAFIDVKDAQVNK